jgi:hypothetical protein
VQFVIQLNSIHVSATLRHEICTLMPRIWATFFIEPVHRKWPLVRVKRTSFGDLCGGSTSSEAHHKKQEGYSQECDA